MPALTRLLAAPALMFALAAPLAAADGPLTSAVDGASLKKGKQTTAGLYITAAEAAEVLAARDDVLLIDVRSPAETMLVGYPQAADANIPFAVMNPAYKLKAKKGSYEMMINKGFVSATKSLLDSQSPAAVLVMCRSGGRSAKAVDALTKAGIDLPLYTVVDGFEGDKNKDGKRAVNGWKNAGADWTYKIREGFLQGVN